MTHQLVIHSYWLYKPHKQHPTYKSLLQFSSFFLKHAQTFFSTYKRRHSPFVKSFLKLCLRQISTRIYWILRVGRKLFTNQTYEQKPKITAHQNKLILSQKLYFIIVNKRNSKLRLLQINLQIPCILRVGKILQMILPINNNVQLTRTVRYSSV